MLCRTLLDLGGLGAAFANFLRWRADLLPTDLVVAFRAAREDVPVSRVDFCVALREDLGARGGQLAHECDPAPCWSSLSRYAFLSRYLGRRVVVQFAREPVGKAEFQSFERSLRKIPGAAGLSFLSHAVLAEFQEWMRLTDDPGRERSYMEAVGEVRDQISFAFPELIPELCTGKILCWYCPEGAPISERLAAGDPAAAGQLAQMALEQVCILGMVDAEFDPADITVAADGTVGVRRWGRMLSLPPALVPAAVKYLSSVMAGESAAAGRMLLRLAAGNCPIHLESALVKTLANSEPELKGKLRFSPSAAAFESNWRSVKSLVPRMPLFLTCLHRNLNALGYWCASAPGQQSAAGADCMAEVQFAVLGRLVRRRLGTLVSRDAATEWAAGSAMLFVETIRQAARTAEDFRDNELAIGIDLAETALDPETRNRAVHKLVSTGMLLVVFLVSAEWGRTAQPPWSVLLEMVAVTAFLGLCWVVVRLG
ncbi:MAG: hypothetical protein JST11_31920 [Acidobacteria bacterium]|nr:hypothetical protein [Acidobacteriota bacterium]